MFKIFSYKGCMPVPCGDASKDYSVSYGRGFIAINLSYSSEQ